MSLQVLDLEPFGRYISEQPGMLREVLPVIKGVSGTYHIK